MRFFTVTASAAMKPSVDTAYLVRNNWDDYSYKTTFYLHYWDASSSHHDLGRVKIGQFGMPEDGGRPNLPGSFTELPDDFFSLGEDDSYYLKLNRLQDVTRELLLRSLNDIAYDPELFSEAIKEPVTGTSL